MGLGREHATTHAPLAHRSFLTLRRKLSLSPEVQQPDWASSGKTRVVLPTLLAGNWDQALKGDQDAIAVLAGRPYEEVAQDLVRYAQESDLLVRQIGSV